MFRILIKTIIAIAVVTNLFIYTYPSANPDICSWSSFQPNASRATPHHVDLKEHFRNDSLSWFQKLTDLETLIGNGLAYEVRKIPGFGIYLSDVIHNIFAPEILNKFRALHSFNTRDEINLLAFADPQIRGPWDNTPYISRLDIFGNDYYLGHIYSTMKRRLVPSHVAVLGDLFSSQWIPDEEFLRRAQRYMTKIFPRPLEDIEVAYKITKEGKPVDWRSYMNERRQTAPPAPHFTELYDWGRGSNGGRRSLEPLLINVTGNHDTGYSGDVTWQHMARYDKMFGARNYWIDYNPGTDRAWRLVVLDDLLLDGPALEPWLQEETWRFVNDLEKSEFTGATVLLTHVGLAKPSGMCTDGPEFEFYPADDDVEYRRNLLKSQNHLTEATTQRLLDAVFGAGKGGVVLVGHDHEGCEVFYGREDGKWTARKGSEGSEVREVTLRSMMGEFGGNSGILTGQFSEERENWEFDFTTCPFVVQHTWWVAKVSFLLAVGGFAYLNLF